jgi:hypothetical protein
VTTTTTSSRGVDRDRIGASSSSSMHAADAVGG